MRARCARLGVATKPKRHYVFGGEERDWLERHGPEHTIDTLCEAFRERFAIRTKRWRIVKESRERLRARARGDAARHVTGENAAPRTNEPHAETADDAGGSRRQHERGTIEVQNAQGTDAGASYPLRS